MQSLKTVNDYSNPSDYLILSLRWSSSVSMIDPTLQRIRYLPRSTRNIRRAYLTSLLMLERKIGLSKGLSLEMLELVLAV